MCRKIALTTGLTTTITAGGGIFSLRNGAASGRLILRDMYLAHVTTTAFTAAQIVELQVFKATGYSGDATGGTAVDLTLGTGMIETGTTAWPAGLTCRVATTGALGAGTRTLEAQPIGFVSGWAGAAGNTIPRSNVLGDALRRLNYPFYLGPNEGIVITHATTMGAAGVGKTVIEFEAEYLP